MNADKYRTERNLMDIIKDLLKNMGDDSKNTIYLREIALLMEEIDALKGTIRDKEKRLKNYEKKMKGKKW